MTTQIKKPSANGTGPAKNVLSLDVDALSLGDCMDMEEVTGEPAFVTFASAQTGQMTAKAMAALVWISKRMDDPTFTFEDAKGIRISTLGGEDGSADSQG